MELSQWKTSGTVIKSTPLPHFHIIFNKSPGLTPDFSSACLADGLFRLLDSSSALHLLSVFTQQLFTPRGIVYSGIQMQMLRAHTRHFRGP